MTQTDPSNAAEPGTASRIGQIAQTHGKQPPGPHQSRSLPPKARRPALLQRHPEVEGGAGAQAVVGVVLAGGALDEAIAVAAVGLVEQVRHHGRAGPFCHPVHQRALQVGVGHRGGGKALRGQQ